MELKRNYHLRLKDEEKLGQLAKENPQLVLPEKRPQFTQEFFSQIGINYQPQVFGKGYIRLFWKDFIVEEISSDGRIISISPQEESHRFESNPEKPKTEADLIKQGVPTFEAIERLSEALKIPTANINHAGLKDAGAITAQEISFNNFKPEQLQNLHLPNLFLKNIHERKGVVEIGNLFGNRFTILVRSSKVNQEAMKSKVEDLNSEGFFNFYSLQRFGPRLLSHKMGKLILQGKYQEAVRLFLVGDSIHEMTVFRNLRKEAQSYWGNWQKIAELFSQFPYFLYYELLALESLKETSIGFVRALATIPDQTKMFVYAYFSFLFNRLLSVKAQEQTLPQELPLLRNYPEIKPVYQDIISPEEMNSLIFEHRGLEFLNLPKKQLVRTKIIPKIWHVIETPVGYIFHFDLEKGAYATTLLSEFFHLYQGKPVPDWVDQTSIDTREPLGYPLIEETENHFPTIEKKELDLLEG